MSPLQGAQPESEALYQSPHHGQPDLTLPDFTLEEYERLVSSWSRPSRRRPDFPSRKRLKARLAALHYILAAFEAGVYYTESDVNAAIRGRYPGPQQWWSTTQWWTALPTARDTVGSTATWPFSTGTRLFPEPGRSTATARRPEEGRLTRTPHDRWLDTGALRMHYRDWGGSGQSLVLLHGLASTCHIWDLVAPILSRDFAVVALDQRGHGETDKPDHGYDFATVVEDLRLFLAATNQERPIEPAPGI